MAKHRVLATLRSKLIAAVLACFILIAFPSLIILYYYMNSQVYAQVSRVNHNWVRDAVETVNGSLDAVIDAVSWICLNDDIVNVMRYSQPLTSSQTLDLIRAQDAVSVYMAGSPAWDNLNKIVVFNGDGVSFTFTKNRYGTLEDVDLIQLKEDYGALEYPTGSYVLMKMGQTINSPYEEAVVAYGRLDALDAYVYAEVDMSVFDPLFSDALVENLFLASSDGTFVYPFGNDLSSYDEGSYSASVFPLSLPDVSVVYYENRRPLAVGSVYGLGVFLFLLGTSFLLFVFVFTLTSRYLTASTRRLTQFITSLSESGEYGLTDPEIERGEDEMAAIGRTVNRMSLSMAQLLERNERLYEEKKESELSMLQMQVNPHFLYNTLESIHYLAKVQKADGIASMSRGLSQLLKSIAKGRGRMIRLEDELALVRDYDEIQQVRYMGMYEMDYRVDEKHLDCLIQEFTLQPLVENAIFHGIEPKGEGGVITVSSHDDGEYLYIDVIDDGVGMDEEELGHIWQEQKNFKGNMTGVGVRNINERIRLYYGQDCGLSYVSRKGHGTRAEVKIRLQREE